MRHILATLCLILATPAAFANTTLLLRVTTPKGEPIPHATVSFEIENYTDRPVSKSNGDLSVTYFESRDGKKEETGRRYRGSIYGYSSRLPPLSTDRYPQRKPHQYAGHAASYRPEPRR